MWLFSLKEKTQGWGFLFPVIAFLNAGNSEVPPSAPNHVGMLQKDLHITALKQWQVPDGPPGYETAGAPKPG